MTCRLCAQELTIDEFYKRTEGGPDTRCKSCVRALARVYYAEHADERKAYVREQRKTYDTGAVRRRRLARGRQRYRENRESEAVRSRAYYEQNRDRWRDYNGAYRAARGADTAETQARIAELRSEPCAYCGSHENIEIDHIVPLSRGGKHEPENLAPACRFCNRSKGAKLLSEWKVGV